MEYPNFKVCVRCFTYNQSNYITDALRGFVIQETDFPFVCFVVDDASNDGEQDVIKNFISDNFDLSENSCYYERETDYAFITYAQHKTNKNCFFAVLYLKENHYSVKKSKIPYLAEWRDKSEYEAYCEGDDYWTAPDKLQIQVDYMDSHRDCELCHTAFVFYDEENNIKRDYFIENVTDVTRIPALCIEKKYRIQTCTTLFRVKTYDEIYKIDPIYLIGHFLMGDTQLWNLLMTKGNVHCISKITSIYRSHSGSACRGGSYIRTRKFQLSMMERRLYETEKKYIKIPFKYKIRAYRGFILHYLIVHQIDKKYEPLYKNWFCEFVIKMSDISPISKLICNHIEFRIG